jgi:hypothetical protein
MMEYIHFRTSSVKNYKTTESQAILTGILTKERVQLLRVVNVLHRALKFLGDLPRQVSIKCYNKLIEMQGGKDDSFQSADENYSRWWGH